MNVGDIVKHRMTGEKFMFLCRIEKEGPPQALVRSVFKDYGRQCYATREFYFCELVKA